MRTRRAVLVGSAIVLFAAACGNSGSSKPATDATVSSGLPSGGPTSTADLTKNVPVDAPGVTDTEIDVAAITAKTNNPTGASFGPLVDGIKAYFKMVDDKGGIYGRKLVVKYDHDDGFGQNRQIVQQSLAQDKPFATFIANALFTGADVLAKASSRPSSGTSIPSSPDTRRSSRTFPRSASRARCTAGRTSPSS